jgi:hypothetical protein
MEVGRGRLAQILHSHSQRAQVRQIFDCCKNWLNLRNFVGGRVLLRRRGINREKCGSYLWVDVWWAERWEWVADQPRAGRARQPTKAKTSRDSKQQNLDFLTSRTTNLHHQTKSGGAGHAPQPAFLLFSPSCRCLLCSSPCSPGSHELHDVLAPHGTR